MADESLDDPGAARPEELEIFDEDVQEEVESQNREIDRKLDALDKAIALLLLAFFKRARGVLKERGGDEALTAEESRAVMQEMELALDESGLPAVVAQYAAIFEPAATKAVRVYEAFEVSGELAGLDPKALRAMAEEAVALFEKNLRDTLIARVGTLISSSTVTGLPIDVVVSLLKGVENGIPAWQFLRDADDGLTQFLRSVVLAKGIAEGFEVFLFTGPIPGACFKCLTLLFGDPHGVQAAYYLDEAQNVGAEWPAQFSPLSKDPLWAGMHSNCRHWWVGVPNEELKAQGFRFRPADDGYDGQVLKSSLLRGGAKAKEAQKQAKKK